MAPDAQPSRLTLSLNRIAATVPGPWVLHALRTERPRRRQPARSRRARSARSADRCIGAAPARVLRRMHLELTSCPECGLPAEVLDRFTLGSTDGPVEHVKVLCITGRWFTTPTGRKPRTG
jgi:hypothetical protein